MLSLSDLAVCKERDSCAGVGLAFTAVGSVMVLLPTFNAETEVVSVGHYLWHGGSSALGEACMGAVFGLQAIIF